MCLIAIISPMIWTNCHDLNCLYYLYLVVYVLYIFLYTFVYIVIVSLYGQQRFSALTRQGLICNFWRTLLNMWYLTAITSSQQNETMSNVSFARNLDSDPSRHFEQSSKAATALCQTLVMSLSFHFSKRVRETRKTFTNRSPRIWLTYNKTRTFLSHNNSIIY